MFDSDDIRYQLPEERPPWELPPTGRLREWFACRAVDEEEARPCQEVGRSRTARERRHHRRQAERDRLQAERAAAQANLRRISTSERGDPQTVGQPTAWDREDRPPRPQARPRPAPRPAPRSAPAPDGARPAAERYVYPKERRSLRQNGRGGGSARYLLIALAFLGVFLFVSVLLPDLVDGLDTSGSAGSFEAEPPLEPEMDEDWADGWEDYFETEEAPAPEDGAVLEQAELPGALALEIQSAEGREALSFHEVYRHCLPSVVSISTEGSEGRGSGTGIVLTADGYILTCNHVIEDTYTCRVTTWDEVEYEARLVGGDAQTDLAVLKIDAQGLTPAEFGDSDALTVGDDALAIGDPLGSTLRGTLTNGIISAINRDVTVNGYQMTLLQTTAALNSGNSGGPLINIYGQVVGVTNMKMNSTNVTVEGLGFAVPTSVVREILPILTERGYVSRPVLGISCYTSDGSEAPEGLIVATIDSASDATARGLALGDCITHVEGEAVTDVSQVREILERHAIGDEITLTVLRQDEETGAWDEELTITITLMEQADLAG